MDAVGAVYGGGRFQCAFDSGSLIRSLFVRLLCLVLSGCKGPLLGKSAISTLNQGEDGGQTCENACIIAISFLSTSLTRREKERE